jgi:hypothetical protein
VRALRRPNSGLRSAAIPELDRLEQRLDARARGEPTTDDPDLRQRIIDASLRVQRDMEMRVRGEAHVH